MPSLPVRAGFLAASLASLDRAIWFYRPSRADKWLLYIRCSPDTDGGRGRARSLLLERNGALVATVMQQGLVRLVRQAQ